MKQILDVTVAAATAVLTYDLLKDVVGKRDSSPRRLYGVGVCGSTAAGDCAIDVVVNSIPVATKYNVATGWPTKDHIMPCSVYVPGDADLALIVVDAPATNPINVTLLFS